ncbi:hypothetical protein MXB_3913 [Myxobolus squamalis]|nr:hypothetical protein MXB_3913 [Myxobolus squamalis]
MNQSLDRELFIEALIKIGQYRKNNLKKVLKIVEKRLKKFPEDQIRIIKILTKIDKEPKKIDEFIPYLKTIAVSKPVHEDIVEALVFCCLSAQKELLNSCLDSDKSNKEAAHQLFSVCSRNDFFHVQIKVYFLHNFRPLDACLKTLPNLNIPCGLYYEKYSPKNAEEPFKTSVPVKYVQRKLMSLIDENLKPSASGKLFN